MAKSVNKVILLGTVGKDPEVKALPSGQTVANFSLATNESYKDKDGQWQERTEWHNLVTYAKTAEVVRDYVKKGHKLYVEGRINTRSWDDKDTGKKVYRTEITVNEISLLSAKESNGEGASAEPSNGNGNSAAPVQQQRAAAATSGARNTAPPSLDEDIPF